MESNERKVAWPIGVHEALGLMLIYLKETGQTDLPWWLCVLPLFWGILSAAFVLGFSRLGLLIIKLIRKYTAKKGV